LGVVNHRIALVFQVDGLAAALVVGRIGIGLLLHLVDLVLGEAAAAGDGDLVLLAGAKVLGADAETTVHIDLEGYLDLRHAARGGWNVPQLKSAQQSIVLGKLALSLEDVDGYGWLIVGGGGENFLLLCRNRGIAGD